ncbi:MAG: hypothetical protein R2695_01290 [Acidimicrobiales bacterium]
MALTEDTPDLGPNAWLVDEMRRWEADPSSVDPQWRTLLENGNGRDAAVAALAFPDRRRLERGGVGRRPASSTGRPRHRPRSHRSRSRSRSRRHRPPPPHPPLHRPLPPRPSGRGHRAREAIRRRPHRRQHGGVALRPHGHELPPGAGQLLEVNRKIINGHLTRKQTGKVSFTHLIGYAVVRAIADEIPAMNNTFAEGSDGTPPGDPQREHIGWASRSTSRRPGRLAHPDGAVHQGGRHPRLPLVRRPLRGADRQGPCQQAQPTTSPAPP